MTSDQLAIIGRRATRHLIPAGRPLFFEGDDVRTHSNIVRGVFHLSKSMADGRQQIVALQFAPAHLPARLSRVTAQAATDSEICSVPASLMKDVTGSNHQVEIAMFMQDLADLDETRNWMLSIGRKSAMEKVASLVLMIVLRIDPSARDSHQFELPLTRAEMADFLGLTIETVSRSMTKLRALEIIRIENGRNATVLSIKKLKEHAGE
ncbi:Crp/Fnr family transcriptional regulator [Agrobacterium deltaense]|uniref:Crp/Fnr family transcriptional regulator n=1 Tax=Agrobacterium deltaense TaxID=1183412 RepID=UPI001C6E792B|nr:Crp/Fnr family transcriptional regulator [Agrobacterium deltaense]MBW9074861.1 Crp/Fnr family transcriptional regulator [Agrobacterium deltaense]